MPRKYFSGGTYFGDYRVATDGEISSVKSDGAMMALKVDLEKPSDTSMRVDQAMVSNLNRRSESTNLKAGMSNAFRAVKPRYNAPEQVARLEHLKIEVEESSSGPLVEIRTDGQTQNPVLYIKRTALASLPYLTMELIKVLDKYVSAPKGVAQEAAEEVMNDLEEILYFLNLSIASKADFLNFVHQYIDGRNPALTKILLYSIAQDKDTLNTIYDILKDQYLWSEKDLGSMKKAVESTSVIKFNPFLFALEYTKIGHQKLEFTGRS